MSGISRLAAAGSARATASTIAATTQKRRTGGRATRPPRPRVASNIERPRREAKAFAQVLHLRGCALSYPSEPGATPARRPNHGRDDGCRTDPDLAHHLEAVAQVERDVPRVRRLEVGQRSLVVAAGEGVTHQLGSEASSLSPRLDADHGQVPVRLFRMRLLHLLEHCQ